MTTKTENAKSLSKSAAELVKAIKATTSPASLALIVKTAIHARDVSLEKDVEELTLKYERIVDVKARKRVKSLCDRVLKLEDRHDIAAVCRAAILHRATTNAKKAAKAEKSA